MILGYKRKNLRCLFANSGDFPLKILIELNELIERFGRFAVGAVGETNLALVNRNAERNLHEGSGGEIILHEALDDAGDADADPGEINQQIHAGDIDRIVNDDMILLQIVVDVLACHVVLV